MLVWCRVCDVLCCVVVELVSCLCCVVLVSCGGGVGGVGVCVCVCVCVELVRVCEFVCECIF